MHRLLVAPDRVPSAWSRGWRLARALWLVVLATTLPVFACTETETETVAVPGDPCKGGVMVAGECLPACDPDKCLDGNVCVGHECKLVCTSHLDCDRATQACVKPAEGTEISGDGYFAWLAGLFGVCQQVRQPVPGTNGWGASCLEDGDCNASACPNGLECDPFACTDGGGVPHPDWCQRSPAACGCPEDTETGERTCVGDEKCNIGTCQVPNAPDDPLSGVPCTVSTCLPNECTPFVCDSEGYGDGQATCVHHDCSDDTDCPSGWYCGANRDPHELCESDTGSWGGCGETLEDCIPADQLNVDGKQLFEGPQCLMRRTCKKRESCAPCEDNLDCSLQRDSACLDLGGELVCARYCQGHQDCPSGHQCSWSYTTCEYTTSLPCGDPMPNSEACGTFPCVQGFCATLDGTAGLACTTSAECPAQACLERKICMPRFGACAGSGQFCEPCVDDTDCGGPESPMACSQAADGEFVCFDFSFPDTCPGGSDTLCPVSPSTAHGECLNTESELGQNPSSHQLYERCYFPYSPQSSTFTCWPYPPAPL